MSTDNVRYAHFAKMSKGEAEENPDGTSTTSYQDIPPQESPADEPSIGSTEEDFSGGEDSSFFEGAGASSIGVGERTDPAIYLGIAVLVIGLLFLIYQLYQRRKRKQLLEMDFLSSIDGEKFNLKLPAAVDEYYAIKAKCEEQGWKPGAPPANASDATSSPHRILAQALMKRCIADIPLVQHIQKESTGMNKLYAQSMCSVTQWRAYQAAETMVSAEVDEVRAEADEIEPGWSQVCALSC